MPVVIIADDLTGALDSAVCFAKRGLMTRVAVSVEAFAQVFRTGADVVAVSTSSREISAAEARERVALAMGCLSDKPAVFLKKVDSRLKGNIKDELDAVHAVLGLSDIFVCPAIPAQGRVVRAGAVCGTGVDVPINIAGIVGRDQFDSEIPDVNSIADICDALPDDLAGTCFVGAAGLAEALAMRLMPQKTHDEVVSLPSPVLFAIGSRDPITAAQVDYIRARCDILSAPNGKLSLDLRISDGYHQVIEMVAGDEVITPDLAGDDFTTTVANHFSAGMPATLLASGGETAAAILEKVGVDILTVRGEVLPGIPVSQATVNGREIHVITKSGGFGQEDALARILSLLD